MSGIKEKIFRFLVGLEEYFREASCEVYNKKWRLTNTGGAVHCPVLPSTDSR